MCRNVKPTTAVAVTKVAWQRAKKIDIFKGEIKVMPVVVRHCLCYLWQGNFSFIPRTCCQPYWIETHCMMNTYKRTRASGDVPHSNRPRTEYEAHVSATRELISLLYHSVIFCLHNIPFTLYRQIPAMTRNGKFLLIKTVP